MKNHPFHYTKIDFDRIINKSVRIVTGNQDSDKDNKILEGKITYCRLSTNSPHIPVYIDFKFVEGNKVKVYIHDMKSIDVLE